MRTYITTYHAVLESQRADIQLRITQALQLAARPYTFDRWQRALTYKHADQPLSARGSVNSRIGGRFNYGTFDPARFTPFPALYIASDRPTALQEQLGDAIPPKGLSNLDLAMQQRDSMVAAAVSGTLNYVLDAVNVKTLQPFVDCIKNFTIPKYLVLEARALNLPSPRVVSTPRELLVSLTMPGWREFPSMYDHPSSSQIFAQLARQAGIEAIVYPSAKSRRPCIAIFPDKLVAGTSFVVLPDTPPPTTPPTITRLDASTYTLLI